MAALSAIAAYDVSDAESDEDSREPKKEAEQEKSSPIEEDAPETNTDQFLPEVNNSIEENEEEEKSDAEDAGDDSENESIIDEIENDEESMIISEDEKELEVKVVPQPVKPKFKRYSCESATALAVKLKKMTDEELHLPPEPEGRCSKQLQEKMKRLYEKKIKEGENLNLKIQERKDFRNPSIYDKLILYLGIEERGTNFSKSDYDPSSWRKVPDYEALARAQREDVAKREKERKTKVEFVTGTVKKPSTTITTAAAATTTTTSEPVKKTKWGSPTTGQGSH